MENYPSEEEMGSHTYEGISQEDGILCLCGHSWCVYKNGKSCGHIVLLKHKGWVVARMNSQEKAGT